MKTAPFKKAEWIVLALFILIGLVNVLAHDVWRDEFQAFLIARESVSIPDMLERLKFEGHPPLWHLMLYPVTRFTGNPFSMQLLHFGVAILSAVVILLFPIPRWQRILMALGYFPLFEFLAISRNYGPGFLLTNLLLLLILQERKRYLLISAILSLLALTSIFGVMMAGLLTLYLVVDAVEKAGQRGLGIRKGVMAAGVILVLSGMFLSILAVAPPKNAYIEIPVGLPLEYDRYRLSATIRTLWFSYIPIPLNDMHFWNTNFLETRFFRMLLAMLLGAVAAAFFFPKRKVFFLYTLGTFALIAFGYFIHVGCMRHFGHLYVLFTVCLVLASGIAPARNGFRFLSDRAGRYFIAIILVTQVAAGLTASALSWIYPFTAGKAVAEYIKKERLEDHLIIGDRDWALTTVAGHLRKPLYHLASHKFATYVIWNSDRAEIMTPEQIVEAANRMQKEFQKQVLMVLNYELKPEEAGNLVEIASFPRSVVADEIFHLYKIDPAAPYPDDTNLVDLFDRAQKLARK